VMTRYVIAIEPLATMPPDAVAAAIAPTIQRYLHGPLSPHDSIACRTSRRYEDRSER
jgi:Tetracyclin repressor-like, C-terminal domain